MVQLVRHRQTKESATDRLHLNHRHEIGLLKLKADKTGRWSVDGGPYVKGKKQGFTAAELTGAGCKLKTVFPWGVHFYQ